MKKVKDLLQYEKAIELMTPFGHVFLKKEDIKNIIENKINEINVDAGCSGTDISVDVTLILDLILDNGHYNKEKETYSYIVNFSDKKQYMEKIL